MLSQKFKGKQKERREEDGELWKIHYIPTVAPMRCVNAVSIDKYFLNKR